MNPGDEGLSYFFEGLVSQPSLDELGEALFFNGTIPGEKKVHGHTELPRKGDEGAFEKGG